MITLNTKTVYVASTPPPTPAPATVMFPKPLSYEFRVVEYVDADKVVKKVALQVQVSEHDEYGAGMVLHQWQDVQRVQFPYVATVG